MSLETISIPIYNELKEVERLLLDCTRTGIPLITDVINYVLKSGGKRLRPMLVLLSSRLAGADGGRPIKYGAIFELIHTASLMHDDVLDNAHLRRHQTTANIKWGNQISILVGDYLWSKASSLAVSDGDARTLKIITEIASVVLEGEILEVVKSNNPKITEEEYLEIIKKKTAALMAACCQVGAILGGVPEQFEAALGEYGYSLGMAFQLTDDILDYSSSEHKLGKTTGSDLREGRLTLPLIITLSRCNSDEAALIKESLIAKSVERHKFLQIAALLNKYDGIEETKRRALKFVERAKEGLSLFKPSIERDALHSLADYIYKRDE